MRDLGVGLDYKLNFSEHVVAIEGIYSQIHKGISFRQYFENLFRIKLSFNVRRNTLTRLELYGTISSGRLDFPDPFINQDYNIMTVYL